jgi:flagellar capping protein FliD
MSAADLTTSMAKFFNAYNDAVSSSNSASSAADGTSVTASARKAATDLRRALSADPAVTAAMQKVGLKISANGTLTQDAKVFADALSKDPVAVRSAMKSIGTKITAASDRELASSGNLESTVSSLHQRDTLLAAQQKAIRTYESMWAP